MLIEYDVRSHPIDTGGAIEARSWFALVDVHLTVSAFGAKRERLDHSQIFLALRCRVHLGWCFHDKRFVLQAGGGS